MADIDWIKRHYYAMYHHSRFRKYIENLPNALVCQDCGGGGGEVVPLPGMWGQGPWEECGWCEGTGLVTPRIRGEWLRMKKDEKARMKHETQT